jgi:hypothetical protein
VFPAFQSSAPLCLEEKGREFPSDRRQRDENGLA